MVGTLSASKCFRKIKQDPPMHVKNEKSNLNSNEIFCTALFIMRPLSEQKQIIRGTHIFFPTVQVPLAKLRI